MATCINPGSLSGLGGAFVPGRDLAGEVVAVGEGVQEIALGDEVLGWVQSWDAHAQLVAVPATQLIAKPVDLPWDVAGCLYTTPMAGLAGVQAVKPSAGEWVVVSGASGGVGFTSAQLARRAGANVIGLASGIHAAWLEDHGVVPVAYGNGQEERIRAAAGGQPIDAFIDAVGFGSVDLALKLEVRRERINTVVDFQAARAHGVTTLGTREAGGMVSLSELADLAADGALEIPIAARYSLEQVQQAYRQVAARQTLGKVVLHPQE